MKSTRVFCAVLAVIALFLMSCNDSVDDLGEGKYLILGNMGNTAFSDGSIQVTISQLE